MYARTHSQRKRDSAAATASSGSRYILRVPSLTLPNRPPAPPPASPPFGLAAPVFPFPALARRVGLAQLGESRETVLATLLGARLAIATMPPYRLPDEQREARARAALAWLDAIKLPATIRPSLVTLFEAASSGRPQIIAAALDNLRVHAADALDDASNVELQRLTGALVTSSTSTAEQASETGGSAGMPAP